MGAPVKGHQAVYDNVRIDTTSVPPVMKTADGKSYMCPTCGSTVFRTSNSGKTVNCVMCNRKWSL